MKASARRSRRCGCGPDNQLAKNDLGVGDPAEAEGVGGKGQGTLNGRVSLIIANNFDQELGTAPPPPAISRVAARLLLRGRQCD